MKCNDIACGLFGNDFCTLQADEADKCIVRRDIFAEKHKGMRVDHSGILGRIAQECKVRPDQRYILGEMDKHLVEMARRFYDGDIEAVDEFLQLYCLDEHRQNTGK